METKQNDPAKLSDQFAGLAPGDTVYIAGPMRGIRWFNFPEFDKARDQLRQMGLNVISPADLDRQIGFDPYKIDAPDSYDWRDLNKIGFSIHDAISRDCDALNNCDAIYMLDGWEFSRGANAEKAIAEWLGLMVVYQTPPASPPKASSVVPVIDGQTVINEHGGKQSYISARFDCIPPIVLKLLAQCLGFGAAKYGKENWKNIPFEDNLAHALNHLNEWRLGDRAEPHLVNAMARITFALWQAVDMGEQPETYRHPDMQTR